MSGLDAPEIAAAYEAVRADPAVDPTNWLLLSNTPPAVAAGGDAPGAPTVRTAAKKNQLVLAGTGTGGLAELREALADDQVAYGYLRIEYANDAESMRTKFALVVWIGPATKVMRRARVSIEAADVKRVLSHYSVQVDAEGAADLEEEEIVARCRRAGGADYNGGRG